MQNDFVAGLSEDGFVATAGIKRELFELIFQRFCGPKTPINQRSAQTLPCRSVLMPGDCCSYHLYHIFYYLKTYPVHRHLSVVTQSTDIRNFRKTLNRRIRYLAGRLRPLLADSWDRRWDGANPVERLFPGTFGIVDTFPVRGTHARFRVSHTI